MKAVVIKQDESVIYKGNIYGYGDSFEVDDSIGKSLIERGYIQGETEKADLFEEEEVCDVKAELEEMSYQDLKAYASELGVSAKGKREELEERILKALAENIEDASEELADFEEAEEEEADSELPNTSMPE